MKIFLLSAIIAVFTLGAAMTTSCKKEPTPAKTYTVTFDAQGGSTVEPQTVKENGLVTLPAANPTHPEDLLFGGWYKEADCINLWDFEVDKVVEDITLYAGWAPVPGRATDIVIIDASTDEVIEDGGIIPGYPGTSMCVYAYTIDGYGERVANPVDGQDISVTYEFLDDIATVWITQITKPVASMPAFYPNRWGYVDVSTGKYTRISKPRALENVGATVRLKVTSAIDESISKTITIKVVEVVEADVMARIRAIISKLPTDVSTLKKGNDAVKVAAAYDLGTSAVVGWSASNWAGNQMPDEKEFITACRDWYYSAEGMALPTVTE